MIPFMSLLIACYFMAGILIIANHAYRPPLRIRNYTEKR